VHHRRRVARRESKGAFIAAAIVRSFVARRLGGGEDETHRDYYQGLVAVLPFTVNLTVTFPRMRLAGD